MVAWAAAIPSIISAIGSIYDMTRDRDEGASGTESTAVTPAGWGSVGAGAEAIFDQAIEIVFGNPGTLNGLTPEEARASADWLEANPDTALYNEDGSTMTGEQRQAHIESLRAGAEVTPLPTPGLREMILEDSAFKEQASEDYLNAMAGHDTNFTNELAGYQDQLRTPAFNLNLGGRNVGVQMGGTRDAISQLSNLASNIYGVNSNAALRDLTQAETYTPNAGRRELLSTLWPMAMQLQNLRFGLPSQTTSAQVSGPSFLENLGNLAESVGGIVEAYNAGSEDTSEE